MFACPATSLSLFTFFLATSGTIAESNWNSPSIFKSGLFSLAIFTAVTTLSTNSP